MTIRNSYPLPLISELLDRVKGAKYFTKLDLKSVYNLVRIKKGDEYKTAFRTRYGYFEYLVMSFGLKNSPATFQHFINDILSDYIDDFVISYIDNILIYSNSLEEHHEHVKKVLKKLLENNLYIKLEKCEFDVTETDRGTQFTSDFWNRLCELLNIKLSFSTSNCRLMVKRRG